MRLNEQHIPALLQTSSQTSPIQPLPALTPFLPASFLGKYAEFGVYLYPCAECEDGVVALHASTCLRCKAQNLFKDEQTHVDEKVWQMCRFEMQQYRRFEAETEGLLMELDQVPEKLVCWREARGVQAENFHVGSGWRVCADPVWRFEGGSEEWVETEKWHRGRDAVGVAVGYNEKGLERVQMSYGAKFVEIQNCEGEQDEIGNRQS